MKLKGREMTLRRGGWLGEGGADGAHCLAEVADARGSAQAKHVRGWVRALADIPQVLA